MANAIALIQKYSSKAWDKLYVREAISSIFDGDKDLLKFTGVKTVKIARFNAPGLADYARANTPVEGNFSQGTNVGAGYGYQQGDASLVWDEFTISCDRAVQLRVELFDDEETDGLAVAAATQEVSRTRVVPEVDAYVFSKIAEYAGATTAITNGVSAATPVGTRGTLLAKNITVGGEDVKAGISAEGNPIYELNKAFLTLADKEVPEEDQVILCSNAFYNMLRNSHEIVKTMRQTEYGENVKFTIGNYEGREIIPVPASRFKTNIQLGANGYTYGETSKAINFMVVAKSAITHVTKYDKVKVFSPAVVQDFDGYKINVRVYHDVFVPVNKRAALYVCTAE